MRIAFSLIPKRWGGGAFPIRMGLFLSLASWQLSAQDLVVNGGNLSFSQVGDFYFNGLEVRSGYVLGPGEHTLDHITVEAGYVLFLDPDASVTVTGTVVVKGDAQIIFQSEKRFLENEADVARYGNEYFGGLPAQEPTTAHPGYGYVTGTLTAEHVVVEAGGAIHANARGATREALGSPQGGPPPPGFDGLGLVWPGMSYGGLGIGTRNTPAINAIYGNAARPTHVGFPGGCQYGTSAGGGAVRLVVGNRLLNHGTISANGDFIRQFGVDENHNIVILFDPSSGWSTSSAGGSGGSVWITTTVLEGAGVIEAKAGGNLVVSPALITCGGGRVAVSFENAENFANLHAINVRSGGGTAGQGSIYLEDTSGGARRLVVVGKADLVSLGDPVLDYDSITVEADGVLEIAGGLTVNVDRLLVKTGGQVIAQGKHVADRVDREWRGEGVAIHATHVVIEAGGALHADGQGYRSRYVNASYTVGGGPGGFADRGNYLAENYAASHGGRGESASATAPSEPEYGSQRRPTELGSASFGFLSLVQGGGAIRLTVADTLLVDGRISANGTATGANHNGAAGGSIWITAGRLSGTGMIQANASDKGTATGNRHSAGGRVAVYYSDASGFSDLTRIEAASGSSDPLTQGTVFLLDTDSPGGDLLVHGRVDLEFDERSRAVFHSISVEDGGLLEIAGGQRLELNDSLIVRSGGEVRALSKNHAAKVNDAWRGEGVTITAPAVVIESGGRLHADGLGYFGEYVNASFTWGGGPGGYREFGNGFNNFGASHGGMGTGNVSVPTYGSETRPLDLGSASFGYLSTTFGGGAIRLIVSGTLTIDGTVSASGTTTVVNCTLDNNRYGFRLNAPLTVVNSIVTHSLAAGLLHDLGPASNLTLRHSLFWNPTAVNGEFQTITSAAFESVLASDHNLNADPLYNSTQPATGLRPQKGSPAIDAADGDLATMTDRLGFPRFDDPLEPNLGSPTPEGHLADLGAYEFLGRLTDAADLAADAFTLSTALGAPGDVIPVSWLVTNEGSQAAPPVWEDLLALSTEPRLNGSSLPLATKSTSRATELAVGEAYREVATVTLPTLAGSWYLGVRLNAGGRVPEGEAHDNNVAFSTLPIRIEPPTLRLDGSANSIAFQGLAPALFRMDAATDADVLLHLDLAGVKGRLAVYLARGRMPTAADFDRREVVVNQARVSLNLERAYTHDAYLLLVPESADLSSQTLLLTAEVPAFEITDAFYQLLLDSANSLSKLGVFESRASLLINLELLKSSAFEEIYRRDFVGPFGRGSEPLVPSLRATRLDAAGHQMIEVVYHVNLRRPFTYAPSQGLYLGHHSDLATIQEVTETYTLHEPNGTAMIFDSSGRLTETRHPTRGTSTFGYDANGRLTTISSPVSGTTTFTYNGSGLVATLRDHNGHVATFSYDLANQLLTRYTDPDGRTVEISYYDASAGPRAWAPLLIRFPDGTTRRFSYDEFGRITSIADETGANVLGYEYDGQMGLTITDPDGHRHTRQYDHRGRLISFRDANRETTHYEYDARDHLTRITHASTGWQASLKYDGAGNPVEIVNPAGQRTTASYLPGQNLLSAFQDEAGHVTRFHYDDPEGGGAVNRIEHPDGTIERFTYDGSGRVLSQTNARGQTTHYQYDTLGRLVKMTLPDGSSKGFVYSGTRDVLTAINTHDGVTSTGSLTFTRNADDQITRVTYPNGRFVDFAYDALGRRTQAATSDGFVQKWSYASNGLLASVRDAADTVMASYEYDGLGRLRRILRAGGGASEMGFDSAAGDASIVHRRPDSSPYLSLGYTYDPLGQVVQRTVNGVAETFAYDRRGQLIEARLQDGTVRGFTYDARENRRAATRDGVRTTYESDLMNRYASVGG